MDFCGHSTKTIITKIMAVGGSAMMPFLFSMPRSVSYALSAGSIMAFGQDYRIAYFLVHDIFIHQRFKMFRNANNWYARGIRRAHKIHHKHLGKDKGECYGMLVPPLKYFKKN
jgi:hypothetical protein